MRTSSELRRDTAMLQRLVGYAVGRTSGVHEPTSLYRQSVYSRHTGVLRECCTPGLPVPASPRSCAIVLYEDYDKIC